MIDYENFSKDPDPRYYRVDPDRISAEVSASLDSPMAINTYLNSLRLNNYFPSFHRFLNYLDQFEFSHFISCFIYRLVNPART